MKDIRDISLPELVDFVTSNGDHSFRAKQIWEWLWKKGANDFSMMTNLSTSFRSKLSNSYTFQAAKIAQMVQSKDKTAKYIFQLFDNECIEGVLIPSGGRVTACISSQVGCALRCAFCATGTMGFKRNLLFYEILDQYWLLNRDAIRLFGNPISNIVFMGMGEPTLNFDNVVKAIEIMTDKNAIGLSPSRITVSTVGLVKGIKMFTDKHLKVGLAVSLHCADERKRLAIMPVTENNRINNLQQALQYYHQVSGERITIEYILLKDITDSIEDAEKLALFCKAFPVKINLINYNTTNDMFEKSRPDNVYQFVHFLERKNLIVKVRKSRGDDIEAACGQLVKINKK